MSTDSAYITGGYRLNQHQRHFIHYPIARKLHVNIQSDIKKEFTAVSLHTVERHFRTCGTDGFGCGVNPDAVAALYLSKSYIKVASLLIIPRLMICIASLLWMAVGPRSLYGGLFTFFSSNLCPFDYTAFVVSENVGIPLTGLTTPIGWLSLLQLTLLIWSEIVV